MTTVAIIVAAIVVVLLVVLAFRAREAGKARERERLDRERTTHAEEVRLRAGTAADAAHRADELRREAESAGATAEQLEAKAVEARARQHEKEDEALALQERAEAEREAIGYHEEKAVEADERLRRM